MSYWKNNQTVLNQIIDEVAKEMDLGKLIVSKVHEWAERNGINGNEYADCCYELTQDVEEEINERISSMECVEKKL